MSMISVASKISKILPVIDSCWKSKFLSWTVQVNYPKKILSSLFFNIAVITFYYHNCKTLKSL